MIDSVARYMICRTKGFRAVMQSSLLKTFMDHPAPPCSKVTHINRGPLDGGGVHNAFSKARVQEINHVCVKKFSLRYFICTPGIISEGYME
jgi:hypothetical protein